IDEISQRTDSSPAAIFDALYNKMSAVISFGRMGKFDYLAMIGKLSLAPIEPGSAYMLGATGPVPGGRLLFCGDENAHLTIPDLEALLINLNAHLNLFFGMQVLEDALCNWQKSPGDYKYFGG
ncbi:MAG: hypothetical protein JWO06_978, partial [Bacteroidota bacterium]|nr:hypothetical protein [Bacteroidota bacterium]